MGNKNVLSKSILQTQKIGEKLGKEIKKTPCLILLQGPMGSGKTTFVRGFCKGFLGTNKGVQSPSYSLINAYQGKSKKMVIHADLFRLKSLDDLESTGIWDYLNNKPVFLIEWGELLESQWPSKLPIKVIKFEIFGDDLRQIVI